MTDAANPASVSRRVATVAESPKGTRTRQHPSPQRLTSLQKESIVTKRVRPREGTIITREYKGQSLQVKVLSKGFEFEGEVYKTISAVAKAITGQHCNGYHFFRLGKEDKR